MKSMLPIGVLCMMNFIYEVPTKVYFGEDAEDHIGEALRSIGTRKVLVHYGSERVRSSGLLDKVTGELEGAGIGWVALGGVEPNPKIGLVRKGVALARKEGVDFLLAIGGGSVCDSVKGIAMGLTTGLDPWEVIAGGILPQKRFPMGAVLTIAAAGSEMSDSCVITNDEVHLKRGSNGPHNRMTFAFMNPLNTASVPPWQTAAGIVDIMMHTMERFLTDEPPTPLTDNIAVGLLRRVIECGAALRDNPDDLEARADMMWASSLAHNDLTGCGRHKTFAAHKIEHDLSGVHDNITHGAGLAVIFPAWVLFEYRHGLDRFCDWAVRVWDAEDKGDKEQTILDGVARMRSFYRSLGMPLTMQELGITPDEYDHLAGLTTAGGTKQVLSFGHHLGKEEIIAIYRLAERVS